MEAAFDLLGIYGDVTTKRPPAKKAAITPPHHARRLGKLFERLEGLPIGGFRLQPVKHDSFGIVWAIERM